MNIEQLAHAKSLGFSDRQNAHLTGTTEDASRAEPLPSGHLHRLADIALPFSANSA